MNMKAKDVYGKINFYGTVLLPLEEAHKIQAILAKYGQGLERVYRPEAEDIHYLRDCGTPSVEVVSEVPTITTYGLTGKQVREWVDAVSASTGEEYLTPQEFISMRVK